MHVYAAPEFVILLYNHINHEDGALLRLFPRTYQEFLVVHGNFAEDAHELFDELTVIVVKSHRLLQCMWSHRR